MATHPQLSTGFIQQIHDASDANDQLPPPPTLQILSIKRANTASKPAATERYRLMVSDGEKSCLGMIATQLNELVHSKALDRGSVITAKTFCCNKVGGRKVLIILTLDTHGIFDKIGSPVDVGKDPAAASAPSTGGMNSGAPGGGMNSGMSGGMNSGMSGGMNSGMSGGMNTGMSGGMNTGMSGGMNSGMSGGMNTGMSGGMNSAASRGMNSGMSKGMNSGMPRMGGPPQMGGNATAPADSNAPKRPHPFEENSGGGAAKRQSMGGPQSSSSSAPINIFEIKNLSPYQNKWTIKARVLNKSDVRTWKNARGEGRLFSFALKDASGEIKVTAFGDQVNAFFDMIVENQVYYISKAQVKVARNRKFSLGNEYEMTLDAMSNVTLCTDNADVVPGVEYKFVKLNELGNFDKDASIDFIGIVQSASEATTLVSKAGKEFTKRELTICDDSGYKVRVTLFGNHAENFSTESAQSRPVLAVKDGRVSDFGGRTLSGSFGSHVLVDPDIPEAHKLKGWFVQQEQGGSMMEFKGYSGEMGAGGGRDPPKVISQIKDDRLGCGEKPDYFTIGATVGYVRKENIAYPACAMEGCQKKAIDNGGNWRCEKCDREFPEPEWRYTLKINVMDHTGSTWMSLFNDSALAMLGIPASEMVQLKENSESRFEEQMQKINFQRFQFKTKAKLEMYQDEEQVKLTGMTVSPIDYAHESHALAEIINSY